MNPKSFEIVPLYPFLNWNIIHKYTISVYKRKLGA